MHITHHYVIHKPMGYLSQFTTNQGKQKNKKMLGELHDFPAGVMAIGRLDLNSEGLLLITTCGKTSELIRSKKIEKEYYVQVDGIITPSAIKKLTQGVEIGFDGKKYTTLPCKATALTTPPVFEPPTKKIRGDHHGPTSWASITVTEGKFKQVRKMTAAVGFPTLRLIRVRIGHILLSEVKRGEVKKVDAFNIY